jgi:hypothetical protein
MASATATANAVRDRLASLGYREDVDGLIVRDTYRDGKPAIYLSMTVEFSSRAKSITLYASADANPADIVDDFLDLVYFEEERLRVEAEDRARELHARTIRFMAEHERTGDVRFVKPEPWRSDATYVSGGSLITYVGVRAKTIPDAKAEVSTPLTELPTTALRALERAASDVTRQAESALTSILGALTSVSVS